MRSEIDEVEAAIRRDILEASNDLRTQLSLSLRDFETFHKSVQQVSSESIALTDKILDKQLSQVGNAARLAAEQITEAFKANQTNAASLVKSASVMNASVGTLTKRLDAIETSTGRLDEQLVSLGDEIERLARRMASTFDEMEKRLSAGNFPTKSLEDQIEGFGAEIEQRLLNRLASVNEEVERTVRTKRWPWSRRVSRSSSSR
jgi:chromosome segregation ATPase